MRTQSYNVYSFDELSDKAKEKARDNMREGLDCEWWECIYSDCTMLANLLGIDIDNIYFSGFSSQGDGACFEGAYSYRKGWRKALKASIGGDDLPVLIELGEQLQSVQKRYFYGVSALMRQSGHYMHSGCMGVDCEFERPGGGYWDDTSDTEEEIKDIMREFADFIYSKLEKEYDWLTSDEQIDESIAANEYKFTEDGVLI